MQNYKTLFLYIAFRAQATILVKKGTLKKGTILFGGKTYCRTRSMLDENGNQLTSASLSTPVQISGWKELPSAGDEVFEVESVVNIELFSTKKKPDM
mgnify:FL=1